MIRFENTIEINRLPSDVFSFTADFTNMPLWNETVSWVKQTTKGKPGTGMVYRLSRKSDDTDFIITDYVPDRLVTIKSTNGSSPRFERRLIFEPATNGTHLVDMWELQHGRNKLIERLAAYNLRVEAAETLTQLKEFLEKPA